MRVLILFYSLHGQIYRMAEAAAEGARQVAGATVDLRRVPETLPPAVLQKMGAQQEAFANVPECTVQELGDADAVLFGTPTRFGNMCGQMRQFLDATGGLWAKGSLVGKPAGIFVSSSTQHGGQESTILTFMPTLLHLGMIVVGLPYTFAGQCRVDEITGGSPYGASTVTGGQDERKPTSTELEGARFQGKHIANIAAKLASHR